MMLGSAAKEAAKDLPVGVYHRSDYNDIMVKIGEKNLGEKSFGIAALGYKTALNQAINERERLVALYLKEFKEKNLRLLDDMTK